MKMKHRLLILILVCVLAFSCNKDNGIMPPIEFPEEPVDEQPEPGVDVVQLPVVVHVIHNGEEIGVGSNLSEERIIRQIEILNEDFRRKVGTKGYNDHPDGADAKIEFVLAKSKPNGEPTNGINRINANQIEVPQLGYNQNHFAQFDYWPPEQYINIWTTPLDEEFSTCIVLGSSTGPKTDLPGTDLLTIPQPGDADGILINWVHFGESNIDCHARFGRTLTHEMGHFLGLLHTWGGQDCAFNDYCEDTPAVDTYVFGSTPFVGCNGETIMIGNYMNYSDDEVMNIFTNDQVARMHYVLKNHKGRSSLLTSPALE